MFIFVFAFLVHGFPMSWMMLKYTKWGNPIADSQLLFLGLFELTRLTMYPQVSLNRKRLIHGGLSGYLFYGKEVSKFIFGGVLILYYIVRFFGDVKW